MAPRRGPPYSTENVSMIREMQANVVTLMKPRVDGGFPPVPEDFQRSAAYVPG